MCCLPILPGAKQILCDSLTSYSDYCLSEGVKVSPQWRTIANCRKSHRITLQCFLHLKNNVYTV